MIRPILACLASLALAGTSSALDDLIVAPLGFDHCEALLVPVLVYTMLGDDDMQSAANIIQNDQDIFLTRTHFVRYEYTSFGILVDLLQASAGGSMIVSVYDADERLTWNRDVAVPSRSLHGNIGRTVLPVRIPASEVEAAFPRAGIYQVHAASYPSDREGRACGAGASTSILVDPTAR